MNTDKTYWAKMKMFTRHTVVRRIRTLLTVSSCN